MNGHDALAVVLAQMAPEEQHDTDARAQVILHILTLAWSWPNVTFTPVFKSLIHALSAAWDKACLTESHKPWPMVITFRSETNMQRETRVFDDSSSISSKSLISVHVVRACMGSSSLALDPIVAPWPDLTRHVGNVISFRVVSVAKGCTSRPNVERFSSCHLMISSTWAGLARCAERHL